MSYLHTNTKPYSNESIKHIHSKKTRNITPTPQYFQRRRETNKAAISTAIAAANLAESGAKFKKKEKTNESPGNMYASSLLRVRVHYWRASWPLLVMVAMYAVRVVLEVFRFG